MTHFLGEQLQGRFSLREVVDSGRATADFRVRQFHKIKIGNGAKQFSRSFADFLSVEKMAGILIRDTATQGIEFGRQADCGKKLSDVARFCSESGSLRVLGFVGRKKMIVFLQRGTTTRGVRNDGVEVFKPKCGKIISSKFARGLAKPRMCGECAAAKLILGNNHFTSVGGKHANGRFVEIGKSDIGDAAGKESHARAARPNGGKSCAQAVEEKLVVDWREQSFALGKAEQLENSDTACDGLQSGVLIEAQEASGVLHEMRSAEEMTKEKIADELGEPRAPVIALNAGAGMLDESSILDARGTGGLASAAVEAFIDVVDEGIRNGRGGVGMIGELALRDVHHLVDAATRRIGFEIPKTISRTNVETKAAVNAARVVFVGGGRAGNCLRCGHVAASAESGQIRVG